MTEAPTKEQTRNAWDATATGFDTFVTPITGLLADDVLGRIDLRPGVRLLDVAAGSGALSIPAARAGADVVAIDIAPAMIDRLRARSAAAGLDIDARVMDGVALDLADDTFDVTASLQGISVFHDFAGGLAEMVRVTKPGGEIVVAGFGSPAKAEPITYFVGAAKAAKPEFTPPPMDPPPLPFQIADLDVFRAKLGDADLRNVTVGSITWELPFESAEHFWNTFTSANPVFTKLAAGLTADEAAEARRVLDGMFREHNGGEPGIVMRTEMNIGVGTK